MKLFTLGVYGSSSDAFFDRIVASGMEALVDVRQRRGVRGSEYAYSNATRLGDRLVEMGIAYVHWKELAPTREIRALQHVVDAATGTVKRQRSLLSRSFVDGYVKGVLEHSDRSTYLSELRRIGPAGLLCVERDAAACHRSLISEWLNVGDNRIQVINL